MAEAATFATPLVLRADQRVLDRVLRRVEGGLPGVRLADGSLPWAWGWLAVYAAYGVFCAFSIAQLV